MICPICDGKGGHQEIIDYYLGGPWYSCGACDGDGEVTFFHWLSIKYWSEGPTWLTEPHMRFAIWKWETRWKLADWITNGGLTDLTEGTDHRDWMKLRDKLYHLKVDSQALERCREQREDWKEKHWSIIKEVQQRVPGETREETARRLIRQAEESTDVPYQAPE